MQVIKEKNEGRECLSLATVRTQDSPPEPPPVFAMSSPSAEVKVEAVGAESTSGLSSPPNVSIISIGGEVRPSAVDFYKGIMEPVYAVSLAALLMRG